MNGAEATPFDRLRANGIQKRLNLWKKVENLPFLPTQNPEATKMIGRWK